MRWREPDPYRWKNRYAIWPRHIGKHWIWLEWYSYRLVPGDEALRRYPWPPTLRPHWLEEFRSGSITAWRLSILPLPMGPTPRLWVSVQPNLQLVA